MRKGERGAEWQMRARLGSHLPLGRVGVVGTGRVQGPPCIPRDASVGRATDARGVVSA